MSAALSGVLVVAIEQAVAAPLCTQRLADAGARVIKVERPEGETARHYDRTVHGTSAYFAWLNRGKESVALDLKDSEDLALVRRLLARADVFVQNLAPGAAERLGLGSRELVEQYPALIAVDIVGYGRNTSYAQRRAYDMLIQAESGLCAVTGTPESPAKVGVSAADIGAGMNAHAAILEALIERSRSGRGRAIEIAMFDCMAEWMTVPLLHLEYAGRSTGRHGLAHAAICPYRAYSCRDGEIMIAVQNPAEWVRFCGGVLGLPFVANDPRFADNPRRLQHRIELDAIIEGVFGQHTCGEMIERLEANRLAWARVSNVEDLRTHPALRRITARAPGGTFEIAASPLHLEPPVREVPALGAHTERIRREFAPRD